MGAPPPWNPPVPFNNGFFFRKLYCRRRKTTKKIQNTQKRTRKELKRQRKRTIKDED
jgi:hypothetical protein